MNTVFQVNNENNNLFVLKPNESFGVFKFGDSISNYLAYKYRIENIDGYFDEYLFYEMGLCVWLDDEKENDLIEYVKSDTYCILNNINIIGMSYSAFTKRFDVVCDGEDIIYLAEEHRHLHRVYDFSSWGLQLWTWRNRIVEVVAYKVPSDD